MFIKEYHYTLQRQIKSVVKSVSNKTWLLNMELILSQLFTCKQSIVKRLLNRIYHVLNRIYHELPTLFRNYRNSMGLVSTSDILVVWMHKNYNIYKLYEMIKQILKQIPLRESQACLQTKQLNDIPKVVSSCYFSYGIFYVCHITNRELTSEVNINKTSM